MRTMVEAEEQVHQQGRNSEPESEVTLGMSSLLGIFFGLVVLCGAFFGFGYSLGHRSGVLGLARAGVAAAPVSPGGDALTDGPGTVPIHAAKPSASGAVLASPVVKAAGDGPAVSGNSEAVSAGDSGSAAGRSGETEAAVPQAARRADRWAQGPAAVPVPVAPASTARISAPVAHQVEASGGTPSMVQVAAVSRQQDADALIAALRKRGYTVSARTEAQDSFLHVQIGPFASRAEANVMRQKLLGDGYNAIVK